MIEIYRNPPTPSHKNSAIAAMCATRDPELLKRSFTFAMSDEVKSQDLYSFFASLANNPLSKRDMWAFYQANFDVVRDFDPLPTLADVRQITERFKGNFSIGNLVKASFSSCVSRLPALVSDSRVDSRPRRTHSLSRPSSRTRTRPRSRSLWRRDWTASVPKRPGLSGTGQTCTSGSRLALKHK